MIATAEVPRDWFGSLKPEVGDTIEVVMTARIQKIEQDMIDVNYLGNMSDLTPTLGGETRVTLVLTDMKMPLHELERLADG
jgi:hypothetical protein